MGFKTLTFKGQQIYLSKAITDPDFTGRMVLVEDPWNYVDLWLKRQDATRARYFWEQARDFYRAASQLPANSAPLAAYYSIMNAAKALLEVKSQNYSDHHGLHGEGEKGRQGLLRERIYFDGSGILGALCRHLSEAPYEADYDLKQVLYNLPYIHRAFCLTYKSAAPLFIPLENPRYVRKTGSREAWFAATVTKNNRGGNITKRLPSEYERDRGVDDAYVVRRKHRFTWDEENDSRESNFRRLGTYHRRVREKVYYIRGRTWLWYLKRSDSIEDVFYRSSMTLTFAAMHRLSELSRYEPFRLSRHFEADHNWLLTEFINRAPSQFIDEVAAEVTGKDFMEPGTR